MNQLFIGLMSGTSLDGIDGVLVDFAPFAPQAAPMKVRGHAYRPFPADFAADLLALNTSGSDELHRAALAGNALARLSSDVVHDLLQQASIACSEVRAIGTHGQTVRHRPGSVDGVGYTLQLNNAALLAELTGIDVVADFRSRDVAAGGQGAPLVPAFHRAMFGRLGNALAVLNIGGISNLTALAANGSTIGFDCGPGNALMDHWYRRHHDSAYDDEGAWAASGVVIEDLLRKLQADPYFVLPPPKSTGRDLFNAAWLDANLNSQSRSRPQDVQATLTDLTAWACAQAVLSFVPDAETVLVCGGGAFNTHLMHCIAAQLPRSSVLKTDSAGLEAMQVEATAFAWLAKAFVDRQPGNLPAVTGAVGPRILGALYPAG